jgi:hypothetical protein
MNTSQRRHVFYISPLYSLNAGLQLGDHELASGDWREGEVLFPL